MDTKTPPNTVSGGVFILRNLVENLFQNFCQLNLQCIFS
jgi:hypothetical protein